MKYVKTARNNYCSISIKDFETKTQKFTFISEREKELLSYNALLNLIVFSPSKQSNLGKKPTKEMSKKIDEITNYLLSKLGINQKNMFVFSSFKTSVPNKKTDIHPSVLSARNSFLCLYVNDGAYFDILYSGVRNALAHGNIVKKGNYYYLFSVSKENGDSTFLFDERIKFLLRIPKLDVLEAFVETYESFYV